MQPNTDLVSDELNIRSEKSILKQFEPDGKYPFTLFNYLIRVYKLNNFLIDFSLFCFTSLLENIIISTKISKYNERSKKQERTFLLTNKYVYNI